MMQDKVAKMILGDKMLGDKVVQADIGRQDDIGRWERGFQGSRTRRIAGGGAGSQRTTTPLPDFQQVSAVEN